MLTNGRRIGARSRYRTGNLMASDGTVADVVNPPEPGSDPETTTDPSFIDISIGILL